MLRLGSINIFWPMKGNVNRAKKIRQLAAATVTHPRPEVFRAPLSVSDNMVIER